MKGRICITYRPEPEVDRWLPGDRLLRPIVRRLVRGRPRPGGIDKVFINLRIGLDRLGISHHINVPYDRLGPDDLLTVLGRGSNSLRDYNRKERFVAGIGLMTHPSQWPTFFDDYPAAAYLQHSEWAANVYRQKFGPERIVVWPVGIDTDAWRPSDTDNKTFDFLIYDKIHWNRQVFDRDLKEPILQLLDQLGRSYESLRYGEYEPSAFRHALSRCRAAIFLSPHESQGIACEEAMAAGVPILAWDPGWCQDPDRFGWGDPMIPTSSVPYFDSRCGRTFADFSKFEKELPSFLEELKRGTFDPRDYILENLTVERCAARFVTILRECLSR